MKTYIDVINETIEYYSQDINRRATEAGNCVYFSKNTGNMCAVGRCLRGPKKYSDCRGDAEDLFTFNKKKFKLMIKPEYKHLDDLSFWSDLQELHDEDSHWFSDGLSPEGEFMAEEMKKRWRDTA